VLFGGRCRTVRDSKRWQREMRDDDGDDRGWDEWCFVISALPISLPRSGQRKGMNYDARNPRV